MCRLLWGSTNTEPCNILPRTVANTLHKGGVLSLHELVRRDCLGWLNFPFLGATDLGCSHFRITLFNRFTVGLYDTEDSSYTFATKVVGVPILIGLLLAANGILTA